MKDFILFTTLVLGAFSCKKDEEPAPIVPTTNPAYTKKTANHNNLLLIRILGFALGFCSTNTVHFFKGQAI